MAIQGCTCRILMAGSLQAQVMLCSLGCNCCKDVPNFLIYYFSVFTYSMLPFQNLSKKFQLMLFQQTSLSNFSKFRPWLTLHKQNRRGERHLKFNLEAQAATCYNNKHLCLRCLGYAYITLGKNHLDLKLFAFSALPFFFFTNLVFVSANERTKKQGHL